MKKIGKAFDKLESALKYACIFLTAGYTVLTFVQVIMRYALSSPLWWSEQVARYMFIWTIMLFAPVILRSGNNLGFDLFLKKMPHRVQEIFGIVAMSLICAFGALYCDYSVQFLIKTIHKTIPGLKIPYWTVYSSEVVGAFLIFLFALEIVINDIIRMRAEKKGE